jgi:hypothetical protein
MTDDEPANPGERPDGANRRRDRWSRWVAIGVLVTFGMFLLWNVVTVLVLVYSSLAPRGAAPFGP